MFPCKESGKEPLTPNGYLDATTDHRKITAWWNRWPDANIGIPTGRQSGFWVLDVDNFTSLDVLEEEHGKLPPTKTVRTGGGGMHVLFRYPASETIRNNAGKLGPGLDVRGEGGYIVAPPSSTTGPYEVLEDLPLADAPEWLLEAVKQPVEPASEDAGETAAVPIPREPRIAGEKIPEGQRNTTLTSIGGSLRARGHDQDSISKALAFVNRTRCSPALSNAEVSKIAASVSRYAKGNANTTPAPEVLSALDCYRAEIETPERNGASDHTDRDVEIALERIARRKGGAMIPSGLRVEASIREIAEEGAIGSTRTVWKSINRLRAAGRLRRDGTGEGPKCGAFVLPIPPRAKGNTKTTGGAPREDVVVSVSSGASPLTAPRLRWSSPGCAGRLGKIRGRIVDLLEAEPLLTLEEIAARLGHKRPWDLRRRTLAPLIEAGVVVWVEGRYSLAADWREALDRRRKEDGELEAAEHQRKQHKRQKEAFKTAWEAGEVISKAERRRRERWRALRDERRAVPEPDEAKPQVGTCIDPRELFVELERLVRPAQPELSPEELEAVEAVAAWERERGPFGFSRGEWKQLFYRSGVWPEPESCTRIANYLGRRVEVAA